MTHTSMAAGGTTTAGELARHLRDDHDVDPSEGAADQLAYLDGLHDGLHRRSEADSTSEHAGHDHAPARSSTPR